MEAQTEIPFVAGVEYFSGLEAGWGYRLIPAIGRPVEISGLTTTTLPIGSLGQSRSG